MTNVPLLADTAEREGNHKLAYALDGLTDSDIAIAEENA